MPVESASRVAPRMKGGLETRLGGWPSASAFAAPVQNVSVTEWQGALLEELRLPLTRQSPAWPGEPIPATFIRPPGPGPFPAVLYIHAHGGVYEIGRSELLDGRPMLASGAYAAPLLAQGLAVLAIDLPCFGERRHWTESALAKRLLWQGDTLFGVMLRELAAALDHLMARPDIDASRIAAMGGSMGATLAWWLAALDERVRAVVDICCLADLMTLIEGGGHDRHGIYMTVPGLLPEHPTASIAARIAPRPHLVCIGALDPLTPPLAVERVLVPLRAAYTAQGADSALEVLIEPASGHVETPAMRRTVLAFLAAQLAGTQPA